MHCDKRRVCHHYLFTKRSQLEKIQQLTDCNSLGSCHAFGSKFLGMFYGLKLNFITNYLLLSLSLAACKCAKLDAQGERFSTVSFQILNPIRYLFLQGGSCSLDFAPCLTQYSLLIVYPSQSYSSNT